MEFRADGKSSWKATDKLDSYEVIRGRQKVGDKWRPLYGCFKNKLIWIGTADDLEAAMNICRHEQGLQEWASNNAENAERNKTAQLARATTPRRPSKPKRPKLYRGR